MLKRHELSDPSSCLNKAKDDELIFVLLARDRAATDAVRAWITGRIRHGLNRPADAQIATAEAWIASVEAEQQRLAGPAGEVRRALEAALLDIIDRQDKEKDMAALAGDRRDADDASQRWDNVTGLGIAADLVRARLKQLAG